MLNGRNIRRLKGVGDLILYLIETSHQLRSTPKIKYNKNMYLVPSSAFKAYQQFTNGEEHNV